VLVALLTLPIELGHHLIRRNKLGLCLLAAVCALPVIAIVLRLRNTRRGASPKPERQALDAR